MPSLITLADPTKVLLNARRGTARAPACDRSCVWLIEHVVGTHVRAQGKKVRGGWGGKGAGVGAGAGAGRLRGGGGL